MKKTLFTLALALCSSAFAQQSSFFEPVRSSSLRLPSVPIIVNDPYLSIWSPYDNLYEGQTEHWSTANKPITGILRVDGQAYRFMGATLKTIVPLANEQKWDGRYTTTTPATGWEKNDFDDSSWSVGQGAFGGGDGSYANVGTSWTAVGDNADIYVRRSFTLDDIDADGEYYVIYRHDDGFELYLNGELLATHGNTEWHVIDGGITLRIPTSLLRNGTNVLAAHCHNQFGGAYADFGLSQNVTNEAQQLSVQVLATSSYYRFQCGPVALDLVFTAPQLIDDLVLLSTPINYISYQVTSTDGAEHDVQFYLETTPELCVNDQGQATTITRTQSGNLRYLRAGTDSQPMLQKAGDGLCQDWGYLYLAAARQDDKQLIMAKRTDMLDSFLNNGTLAPQSSSSLHAAGGNYPAMSYLHELGKVDSEGKRSFTMLGYDDIYCIQYMNDNRQAYWRQNPQGRNTIQQRFSNLQENYESIMMRCRALDEKIYDDGLKAGGRQYAEILSASYRQVISAHKLTTDKDGRLLFMSKENNSGGFINTLDITYPSAPLFLIYNTDLLKGMMTPVFQYSATGKWDKDFANHDLGSYPLANGQTYGGDMPVEESGNMVILSALIAKIDGNTEYISQYWDLLTRWTNYLVQNGRDPVNQLCTDDFAGPSARNVNLSMKAIMAVASYIEMGKMLGKENEMTTYQQKLDTMIRFWKNSARVATPMPHYRLGFGTDASTWSEKYNMVWDLMWDWNYFEQARTEEMAFYQTKMQTYGLPLDNRPIDNQVTCKNDWMMWVAAMSATDDEFQFYVDPMYRYISETTSRMPISDHHNAERGTQVGYRARSVIGGYWMKVLMDLFRSGELLPQNIGKVEAPASPFHHYYDLQGRPVNNPAHGLFISKEGNKSKKIARP